MVLIPCVEAEPCMLAQLCVVATKPKCLHSRQAYAKHGCLKGRLLDFPGSGQISDTISGHQAAKDLDSYGSDSKLA